MKKFLVSLLKDESGLTTVEYAVGAAVVTMVGVVGFAELGQQVGVQLTALKNKIK